LLQVEAAAEAARMAMRPAKPAFVVGFLIGQEVAWLPDTLRILREEAPDVEISIVSQSSPELASALMRGKVDVAFMRREQPTTGLAFKLLVQIDPTSGARARDLYQSRPHGAGAEVGDRRLCEGDLHRLEPRI
jgi:DNA-binding transcriptional LysR family regulator